MVAELTEQIGGGSSNSAITPSAMGDVCLDLTTLSVFRYAAARAGD